MEDLDSAGINFGVISFFYLLSIFYILKFNSKSFMKTITKTRQENEKCLDQISEAFVFFFLEQRQGHTLICIEKVVSIFVIFTNQEMAQSIFGSYNSIINDNEENLEYLYVYLIIPLIGFGGYFLQKVFYYLNYCFYEKFIYQKLVIKYRKLSKFAFSDPRSRSMFFFGYIITNLIVILVVFSDSNNGIFSRCVIQALISSAIQIFGFELLFVFLAVFMMKVDDKIYAIIFQQKKEKIILSEHSQINQNDQESNPNLEPPS
ncbi:unnamed protein product [Paramecium sonneborni]|uniref:Transmembrane protein n=1 Tax=Paramecium sonneborni TaxID=65129 RepID=A0A8S1P3W6_9CILI|nr:unnamed protein product [Paramecium sonneborni]